MTTHAAKYEEIQSKTVLNKHKFINPWGWNRYSVHAYIGCEHACEYCYERFDKYFQFQNPGEFTRKIKVKTNAPEVFARQLSRVKRDIVALDKYQPAELQYGLNRKLLEIIRDKGFPCFVLEKSDILLRDIDILEQISRQTWCNTAYSISVLDKNLVRLFEPHAPSPEKRLDAVKQLADRGIMVGVFLLPVIPYISDDEETLDKTIEQIKAAGAKYVLVGSMTLSPGQKDRFFTFLDNHFPGLKTKYLELYRKGQSPEPGYASAFSRRAAEICRRHGIRDHVPRNFIPEGMPKKNYEISTMLFRISQLLEGKGESPYRYMRYMFAAQSIEAMSEDISMINQMGKLEEIPKTSGKILEMIKEKLTSGRVKFYDQLRAGQPGENDE